MSRLSKWLRSFKKKKKKSCTTTTVVKDPKSDPKKDEGAFEAGEKTVYDCIVEAKALGLDMREVNATLSTMKGKEFVIWFEANKNNMTG
jgi:hypothetical protein